MTPEERFVSLVRTDVEAQRAQYEHKRAGGGGQHTGRWSPDWPYSHLLEMERYLRWYDSEKQKSGGK